MIESFKEEENPVVVTLTMTTRFGGEPMTDWHLDIFVDDVEEHDILSSMVDLRDSISTAKDQLTMLIDEVMK